MSNTVFMFEGVWYNSHSFGRKFGINPATVRGRLNRGWPPDRLLEPVDEKHRSKWKGMQQKPVKQKPIPWKPVRCKPYDEEELLELYRMFQGQSDELTRLADFMIADAEAASQQIVKWKKEGRI